MAGGLDGPDAHALDLARQAVQRSFEVLLRASEAARPMAQSRGVGLPRFTIAAVRVGAGSAPDVSLTCGATQTLPTSTSSGRPTSSRPSRPAEPPFALADFGAAGPLGRRSRGIARPPFDSTASTGDPCWTCRRSSSSASCCWSWSWGSPSGSGRSSDRMRRPDVRPRRRAGPGTPGRRRCRPGEPQFVFSRDDVLGATRTTTGVVGTPMRRWRLPVPLYRRDPWPEGEA